jgi:hypothetical protein
MTPKELYKQRLLSIRDAVSLVHSHQTIAVGLAGCAADQL